MSIPFVVTMVGEPSPKFQVKVLAPMVLFMNRTLCGAQPKRSLPLMAKFDLIEFGLTMMLKTVESFPQSFPPYNFTEKVFRTPVVNVCLTVASLVINGALPSPKFQVKLALVPLLVLVNVTGIGLQPTVRSGENNTRGFPLTTIKVVTGRVSQADTTFMVTVYVVSPPAGFTGKVTGAG